LNSFSFSFGNHDPNQVNIEPSDFTSHIVSSLKIAPTTIPAKKTIPVNKLMKNLIISFDTPLVR